MAAAASAPPPQTPHTIEAARPAGLGGAATPAGHPRLPVAACACHGPPSYNLGSGRSDCHKNRRLRRPLEASEDRQTLTSTQKIGVAGQK